jgi:arylsulfatase I/J
MIVPAPGQPPAGVISAFGPQGRGYESSLLYFNMLNDYWTEAFGENDGRASNCTTPAHPINFTVTDLWNGSGPAVGLNNSKSCSAAAPEGCVYEDDLFVSRVLATIQASNASLPFFFFWAPHSVHQPYEAPRAYVDKFAFIDVPARRLYAAQVNYIDDQVGKVVAALKAKGLWDDMLFVMSSDNGGALYYSGNLSAPPALANIEGGNNWPLRGGKMSNTEGGVRVPALVNGGLLPPAVRGTTLDGFVAVEDWYTTFCRLAGVNPWDARAAAAGLPPVDGVDVWPMLSGASRVTNRTTHFLGFASGVKTTVQGVIRVTDGWKLLLNSVAPAFWQGPSYPNASSERDVRPPPLECGDPLEGTGSGCLFNILRDPHEVVNAAASNPSIVSELRALVSEAQLGVFSPDRGPADSVRFCEQAVTNGGFVGPFLP